MSAELIITCDRCGKQNGDSKSVGSGLSISNLNHFHLCSTCVSSFVDWCRAKPGGKAEAKAKAK